jgi:hypothetical protein
MPCCGWCGNAGVIREAERAAAAATGMVGRRGFEPPASCSRSRRSTRLSYPPTGLGSAEIMSFGGVLQRQYGAGGREPSRNERNGGDWFTSNPRQTNTAASPGAADCHGAARPGSGSHSLSNGLGGGICGMRSRQVLSCLSRLRGSNRPRFRQCGGSSSWSKAPSLGRRRARRR